MVAKSWLLALGTLAAHGTSQAASVTGVDPEIQGRKGLISNTLGDHMVLQWSNPRVYGWSTSPGAHVTVKLDGSVVGSAESDSTGYWQVDLPEQKPSSVPHNISAEAPGDAAVSLSDVLFGEVFLCSGQSNMEFDLRQAFGGQDELDAAASHQDIRLFLAAGSGCFSSPGNCATTAEPQKEFATALRGWSKPDAAGSMQLFSALCWFTARQLQERYNTPVGLIESSIGGTYVEAWSSREALAQCSCDFPDWAEPNVRSGLWNALVNPLAPMRLSGVMWYQGETNEPNPSCYSCSFPAMIQDWRAKFDATLPFGFVQLAAWNDTSSTDLIPQLRLSQQAALALPLVGVASATDLGDPESPWTSIHPRHKKEVADRMAKVLAHLIWNETEVASPVAKGAARASDHSVDVTFGEPLEIRDAPPCPAAYEAAQCGATAEVLGSDGKWHPATLKKVAASTIRISAPGVHARGARYLFANYPLSTVYSKQGLPALPFSFSNVSEPSASAALAAIVV